MSEAKASFIKSPLVLLLAPTLAILAVYYLAVVPLLDRNAMAQAAEAFAVAESSRIDQAIVGRKIELGAAGRDRGIGDVLLARELEQASLLATDWSNAIDGAQRVVLLPFDALGHAGLGDFANLLGNNIERDLVSRAAKEGQTVVDVYLDDSRQRLLFAAPVVGRANTQVGVILVELKPDWLQSLLERPTDAESASGRLSRIVMSRPSRAVLAEVNIGMPADAVARASVGLEQLEQVALEVSVESKSLVTKALGALLAITGALVAVMGLSLPVQREIQVRARLARDAEKLSQFFTGSLRGAVSVPKLEFEELHDLAATVKQSVARFKVDEQARDGLEQQMQSSGVEDSARTSLPEVSEDAGSTSLGPADIPAQIFRAYDIRGKAGAELTDEVTRRIGQAFGSQIIEAGESIVAIACDTRLSSPRLIEQLRDGLCAAGCAVIDLGLVPTPLLYFAAQQQANGNGVMITGSHNPVDENGFKFVLQGQAYVDDQIQTLRDRASAGDFVSGEASSTRYDCVDDYVDACADDVVFAAPAKVVIDCGNGAASEVAPILYASLGAEAIPLFAEPDGSFPNRSPLPSAENLDALVAEVQSQQADLGLAFDGDGDRVVAVSASGKVIPADQLLMLFAKDMLARNPGSDVVFDVKCSRSLNSLIAGFGGRPVLWKSGHSRIKQKMRETGALLGGEFSGHFFFAERWFGFDDGLYAGARLIELLTLESRTLDEALADLPPIHGTDEIRIAATDDSKFGIVDQLTNSGAFDSAELITVDGLRAEFADGWGLVRASNTGPELTARFEADSPEALQRIASLFADALAKIDASLQLKI